MSANILKTTCFRLSLFTTNKNNISFLNSSFISPNFFFKISLCFMINTILICAVDTFMLVWIKSLLVATNAFQCLRIKVNSIHIWAKTTNSWWLVNAFSFSTSSTTATWCINALAIFFPVWATGCRIFLLKLEPGL